jgi:hypothetical protein
VQISAILIGLVLLAAEAFYVSRPILQPRRAGADSTTLATLDALDAQRDAVYSQIRELDMDHATGKMNDEDYQPARADLIAQAATLLKQIDGAWAAQPAAEDVEALIAARRKAMKSAAACPACGKPGTPDDAFCAKCGAPLKAVTR